MARQTETSTASADKPRRRLLNIGPGLIIALAISIFIGVRWFGAQKQMPAAKSGPPIVERQVISSTYEEKAGPTPEVRFILERRHKLGLSAAQVAKLNKLQSEWQRLYGPKIAQANSAAVRAQDYLAAAKGNRSTPVAQIKDQAASLVALSREISSARRDFWVRATGVLTVDQRGTLQSERETDWAAKTKALSAKSR